MGRKRKCAGCKILLSDHSFGPPSSKCEGLDADVLEHHVQDSSAVEEICDAAAPSVGETHVASSVPSELARSLEAQRSQNAKLHEELAVLQQQQELRVLEEEGGVLQEKLQCQKPALPKFSVSAESPFLVAPIPTT